ncbi:MAG: hypothetical protein LBR52_03915 [Prevotellaceae bacterium]|jgi:hypothetical protein|nr:hypothetical protein [Prevotellaceae bacterium]
MKKLFIFFTVTMLTVNVAFAEKGDWALGGSISFDYSGAELIDGKKNGESLLNFKFAPTLLYGISKRVYFGGELSADMHYNWNYLAGEKISDDYKNLFGIAPILRYYFLSHKRVGLFADAKLGLSFGTDKVKTTYTDVNLSVTPGVEFFINSRFSASVALNEMLGFGYEHAKPKGGVSTNSTYFHFILNKAQLNYAPLTITFTYHIRPHKNDVEIIEINE